MNKKNVYIAGVPIGVTTYNQCIKDIHELIAQKKQAQWITVNPEMILNAQQDDEFRHVLKQSTLNTADGIGVLWASYFLSLPKKKSRLGAYLQLFASLFLILLKSEKIKSILPERVTGADLAKTMVAHADDKWSFFFLGAAEGVAKRAAHKLRRQYPHLKIAGYYSGSPALEDEEEIGEQIKRSGAKILMVAYGSPQQELWIRRNLFKWPHVNLAIGVGGTFDFYSGNIRRSPKFLQRVGLEWLWRLTHQPSRFSRIWNATIRFIRLIFREKYGTIQS